MGFFDWLKKKKKPEAAPPPEECLCYCVPQSIACAWSFMAKHKTEGRIAVQHISEHSDHSQAQCLIDGEWTPLIMYWTKQGPAVRPGHRHFPVEPYRYLTLREWIDEQIEFTDATED